MGIKVERNFLSFLKRLIKFIQIKENIRLKKCNVSFNGFDLDGGKMLADVIKNNTALEHFDMSNTRLNAECAASIANALGNNETLKSLNVKI